MRLPQVSCPTRFRWRRPGLPAPERGDHSARQSGRLIAAGQPPRVYGESANLPAQIRPVPRCRCGLLRRIRERDERVRGDGELGRTLFAVHIVAEDHERTNALDQLCQVDRVDRAACSAGRTHRNGRRRTPPPTTHRHLHPTR